MCQKFLHEFVNQVIQKLEDTKECTYVVMYIDECQTSACDVWREPPSIICKFTSTNKNLCDNLYDELMKWPYYMAYIIRDLVKLYPSLFDTLVKDWYIFFGDMDDDQFQHICEIFDANNGRKIFRHIHENGGLLKVFDKLEVNCGYVCLLKDSNNIFEKLSNNGLNF